MQHKVNIDKEYNFIEALRDDHYASFGGVRNSRGRGLRMADDLFCGRQKHHGGEIHASKLQKVRTNGCEYEKETAENTSVHVKHNRDTYVYWNFDQVVDRAVCR